MYSNNVRRLSEGDYNKPCKDLAVFLLGKILVRKLENQALLKGRIVETECYLGGNDKASHSYKGKMTKRNEPMYMPAGTAYVYVLYFGYHCFNISSLEPGAVVLIRALEPLLGMHVMKDYRAAKMKNGKKILKHIKLCDGPSKLCLSMDITRENSNKLNLADPRNDKIWLEESLEFNESLTIINSSRIGIGPAAEEWTTKPLRYYIFNNASVSKRDKKTEKMVQSKIVVHNIL